MNPRHQIGTGTTFEREKRGDSFGKNHVLDSTVTHISYFGASYHLLPFLYAEILIKENSLHHEVYIEYNQNIERKWNKEESASFVSCDAFVQLIFVGATKISLRLHLC